MFKEMTTKKKIIIGVIVLAVIIICVILFIKSRNKKKQAAAANKAEESIQRTVSSPAPVEKKRSQIVPEEDMQAVKTTPETKLSVEEVIPAKEPVAATAPPQVNNGNMKEGKPAVMQTKASALPPEFMINANNPSA